MSNNGSLGGIVDDADFAAFDAFPAEIRRAFAEAPYDLAFGDVAEQLAAFQAREGRPLNSREIAFAVEAIRDEHGFELGVTAYALYGADHPQARVVSIECLADLNLLSIFGELKRWRAGGKIAPPARTFKSILTPEGFESMHADRPRRRGVRGKRSAFADRAMFNPRRDVAPVYADAAAQLMGDPPIGRRAIDQRRPR